MEERSGGIDQVGVQSLDNLCGDLNKGYLPKNPMKRDINGHSYPLYGPVNPIKVNQRSGLIEFGLIAAS